MEEDDAKLKLLIGESKSRLEDTIITRGAYLYRQKNYHASLACWKKLEAMRGSPKDARYEELDGLARCYLHLEDLHLAQQNSERLVLVAPSDSAAWELHGRILEKLAQPLSTYGKSFLRSMASPSPVFQVYLHLASAYQTAGNVPVVKYLIYKAKSHMRGTRLLSNYNRILPNLEALEEWVQSNIVDGDESAHLKRIVEDAEGQELESRLFGPNFSRVVDLLNSDSLSNLEDSGTDDVKDPSKM